MRLTMGEFAGTHRVSRKLLRYYREIGLLLPAGVNPENGYAYYDEAESERLRKILYLRGLRFSLEEIRNLLPLDARGMEEAVKRKLYSIRAEMRILKAIERSSWFMSLKSIGRYACGARAFCPSFVCI